MKKVSKLDQIVLCADGCVALKFLKQVVDDDGTIIASIPHRAIAQPWEDPANVMAFNAERLGLKHAAVDKADSDWLDAAAKARKQLS
jgi:hypothetical protein